LLSAEEIGERFKLTARRIQQIVYANKDFLKIEIEWEKSKRVRWYQQQIVKSGDSKKDSADLQDKLRVELEGDKPLVNIDNSVHITKENRDKYRSSIERLLGHRAGNESSLKVYDN